MTEHAHTILGVPGRLWTIKNPGARAAGCWDAQKWVSFARPIDGYGRGATLSVEIRFDDECKNGRNTFAITAEVRRPGRRDVEACGCLHDEVAAIFPELAHLIQWHLCSNDGPMHYVADTCYHALQHGAKYAWVYYTGSGDPLDIGGKTERLLGYVDADKARTAEGQPGYRVMWDGKTAKARNLSHARSSACWPEATDEQLTLPRAELEALLWARLPALLQRMRADIEAAGFVWQAP